ncbi:hypothetical protein OAU50_02680 [Planctomycetota bacterium]|nr:hypothetical protein [Planctomycetota bacterium]
MIYFAGEKENELTVYSEELRELSENEAIFIKFDYNGDREDDPFAEESVVPTSPLLSDNPARDYGVPTGSAGTILVCDWYGNKYFQLKSKSKASAILAMVGKVSDKVEKEEKSLRKNLEKAQASMEKDDRKNAIKSLLKNFKDGQVGLDAQQETITLYHEIMDAAREELSELATSGDVDALKKLAGDMKKTDLEGDIKSAIKGIS